MGGAGNDTYIVDNQADTIVELGSEGTDTVQSSVGYALSDNVERLTLTGTAAINATGNALANILTGNSGDNILDGGAGNDTYVVDSASDTITEAAGADIDTILSSATYTISSNVENITLIGAAAVDATGNTLNNILVGNSADNTLSGGTGADTMVGGLGNDTYVIDIAGDVVTELAGEGIDTIRSSLTYSLAANFENLTLTGSSALNATGNVLDNILTGNSGTNTLTGDLGNDTYVVQSTSDIVVELAGEGIDTLVSSVSIAALVANVENLVLTGSSNLSGTGNALNNSITGNAFTNTLNGDLGDDTLTGGAGNDTQNELSKPGGLNCYALGPSSEKRYMDNLPDPKFIDTRSG